MSRVEVSVYVPLTYNNSSKLENTKHKRGNSDLLETLYYLISDMETSDEILYPTWNLDLENKYKQVSFFTRNGKPCDEVISKLKEHGFGVESNSAISVSSSATFICHEQKGDEEEQADPELDDSSPKSNSGSWDRFVRSLDPFVAAVFQSVKRQAVLTWDFNILLLVAALTALMGLIENSSVILVASMLISPMMGPVMAVLFGTLTKTRKLQKLGVCNCLLTVLLCILIGFLFGLILLAVQIRWRLEDLPTYEMVARGTVRSLWVGLVVAFLAGAAIATATLNDRWQDSIMGGAISVAILPPAVNAGLLWSMAVFSYLYEAAIKFPENYSPIWSNEPALEYLSLGAISLGLTFINVVAIFIGGAIILKVKKFQLRQTEHLPWGNFKFNKNEVNSGPDDDKVGGDYFYEFPSRNSRWSFSNCLPNTSEISYRNLHTWTPGGNNWAIEGKPSALDLAVRLAQERTTGTVRYPKFKIDANMTVVAEVSSEQHSRFNVTPAPDNYRDGHQHEV